MTFGPRPADDPIATPPVMVGPYGRAWRRDLDAVRRSAGVAQDADAMLASWVIEAAWAHPLWHSYNLTLVHLRPTPRLPAPILHRADATHELMLFALDPTEAREPMLHADAMRWLQPANFGAQIVEVTDATAIKRIEHTVALIVADRINPDTDARSQWIELFGSSMIRGNRL